jgi:hypothetical protein
MSEPLKNVKIFNVVKAMKDTNIPLVVVGKTKYFRKVEQFVQHKISVQFRRSFHG